MRWLFVALWILGGVILTVNTVVLIQLAPQLAPTQQAGKPATAEATVLADADTGNAGKAQTRDEMPEIIAAVDGEERTGEADANDGDWVEVRSAVNIRAGPSRRATRLGTYQSGVKLQAMGSESGWVQVFDPDTAETGWIYENYLAEVKPD